jgi:hypothetical protein
MTIMSRVYPENEDVGMGEQFEALLHHLTIAVAKALAEKHGGKVSSIDGEGHADPRSN